MGPKNKGGMWVPRLRTQSSESCCSWDEGARLDSCDGETTSPGPHYETGGFRLRSCLSVSR